MPSPAPRPARAGHYVNLESGAVNFYCNCGNRAHNVTLRYIDANTDKFAVLTPAEVKEWQQGKLTFAPKPVQLELPLQTPAEVSNAQ